MPAAASGVFSGAIEDDWSCHLRGESGRKLVQLVRTPPVAESNRFLTIVTLRIHADELRPRTTGATRGVQLVDFDPQHAVQRNHEEYAPAHDHGVTVGRNTECAQKAFALRDRIAREFNIEHRRPCIVECLDAAGEMVPVQ